MSECHSVDDAESLRSALQEVLEDAQTNGVEIEGSLLIQTTADHHPDWEVQIWQVN